MRCSQDCINWLLCVAASRERQAIGLRPPDSLIKTPPFQPISTRINQDLYKILFLTPQRFTSICSKVMRYQIEYKSPIIGAVSFVTMITKPSKTAVFCCFML